MDDEIKTALNRLASIFYKMHGYEAREGFDFSQSTHPQERLMFRMAEQAYEFMIEEGLPRPSTHSRRQRGP